jgi:hypothetical protein
LRAFVDDSGSLPESGRVHCVFCGAAIPQRRKRRAQDRVSAVPFSKDVEREEAFALGVIGAGSIGFPDTLRQFRVQPTSSRPSDTLMPVAHGAEHTENPELDAGSRAPWRRGSFWASLTVGLVVGVTVASVATSLARQGRTAVAATPSPAAAPQKFVAPVAPSVAAPSVAAPPVVAPVPACAPSPLAPLPVVAAKLALPRAANHPLDRQGLLERARSRQREYRLGDAERLYRQVLARAPSDSEALAGLGEVDVLRGITERADAHFRQALRVNADYIPALIAVADLQWQAGRGREAQQAYREIVERYDAELYPPYVAQRSTALVTPQCGQQ